MSRASILRVLVAILLTGLGWAAVCAPAEAKLPKDVSLNVTCGYDNIVQLGRVNPVTIDLDNHNPKLNIDGELVLDYEGIEYATKLKLPTPSKKRYTLYFPCNNYSPLVTLRIRSKAYTDEFLLSEPKNFKSLNAQDVSVLVISKQSGSLGMLNQLSTARLFRDLYSSTNAQLGAGHISVSYVRLEEVDPTPKYFASADVVVLGDIDYQQATTELAEALKAAVAGGTSLVFSLGLNGSGVSGSPLAALCPLQVSGSTQLSDLGSFGSRYRISGSKAVATLSSGQVAPGAKVLASAGSLPVVVQKPWGSGTATALAFDFTQQPFKQNPRLAAVFRDAVLPVGNNIRVTNWLMHPDSVRRITEGLAEAKPIPPGFVALYLLAYVLLIGPLNFLVLDRLKKRTFVWTSIPLLVIGFTYLGLSTGYLYRGSQNICAYVQELHIYPDAAYVPYQTVMLVFTSESTSYKLEVPDKSAFIYPKLPQPMNNNMLGMGGGTGLETAFSGKVDSSGAPVVSATQNKWSGKNYFYQGYLDLQSKVTANITATRQLNSLTDLRGSFTLDLPFDLIDCRLYTPEQQFKNLGNLRGKGEYTLPNPTSNLQATLDANDYLSLPASRTQLANLQTEAAKAGLMYRDEILLLGYTDQLPAMAKFGPNHKQYALSLVVVHLPFKAKIADQGRIQVSRILLSGGSGFSIAEDYGPYNPNPAIAQLSRNMYQLQKDSYVSFSYELAGEIRDDTKILVRMNTYDSNQTPLPDVASYLTVQAWNGSGWQEMRIPAGANNPLYFPIRGLVDDQRRLTLRFKALKEVLIDLPTADAYE